MKKTARFSPDQIRSAVIEVLNDLNSRDGVACAELMAAQVGVYPSEDFLSHPYFVVGHDDDGSVVMTPLGLINSILLRLGVGRVAKVEDDSLERLTGGFTQILNFQEYLNPEEA
jgi:hypothetical protein